MGLITHRGTMPGAFTPICNECGVHLCWDVGEEEANQDRQFWDAWICQDCNGGVRMSVKQWREQRGRDAQVAGSPVAQPTDGAASEGR